MALLRDIGFVCSLLCDFLLNTEGNPSTIKQEQHRFNFRTFVLDTDLVAVVVCSNFSINISRCG